MFSLLLAALLPGGSVPADDDLVPATLDALLAAAEDPVFSNLPQPPRGDPVFRRAAPGGVRVLLDVGDVTGDGAPDLAVGLGAGGRVPVLSVLDGRSGAPVWRADLFGGGFRSPRALAVRDGALIAGASGRPARVERRDTATGAQVWSRELSGAAANVHAVAWVDDLDGDHRSDVLVAAGAGIDAVLALSGADGHLLWRRPMDDVVYDVLPHDGAVFAVGGDDAPFATRLAGADGLPAWSVPLDGPGVLVEPLPDGTGVLVGVWAAPEPGVVALAFSDGSPLWSAPDVPHDVTGTAWLSGGDGLLAVASFDNAISVLDAADGVVQWRREGSPNNGGAMLAVAAAGDLNGNGTGDMLAVSVDHQLYVMDGDVGKYLARADLGSKALAVASLGDGDGDGRPEAAAGAAADLAVVAGSSGLASGPTLLPLVPNTIQGQYAFKAQAFGGEPLFILGALAPGRLVLPGGTVLGLDPSSLALLHAGVQSATGETKAFLGPFTQDAIGVEVFGQAVTAYGNGTLSTSPVASFTITP